MTCKPKKGLFDEIDRNDENPNLPVFTGTGDWLDENDGFDGFDAKPTWRGSLATLPHRRDLSGQMVGRGWTEGMLTVCSMFPTLNAMA